MLREIIALLVVASVAPTVGNTAMSRTTGKGTTASVLVSGSLGNWEVSLTSVSSVIRMLGQLMIISSKTDFKLAIREGQKFEYIKYGDSFSATMVQLSNMVYRALQKAQENMQSLYLNMLLIPETTKKIHDLLNDGTMEDLQDYLPIELDMLDELGSESTQKSEEVYNLYDEVQFLVSEVLVVTREAQSAKKEEERLKRMELNVLKIMKEQQAPIVSMYAQQFNKTEKVMKRYTAAFEEAMDAIPTGWEAIAQEYARMLINVGGKIGGALAAGVQARVGGPLATLSAGLNLTAQAFAKQTKEDEAKTEIIAVNGFILGTMTSLSNQIDEIMEKMDQLSRKDGWEGELGPADSFKAIARVFTMLKNLLSGARANKKIKTEALKYLTETKTILGNVGDLCGNSSNLPKKEDLQPHYTQLKAVQKNIQPFMVADAKNDPQSAVAKDTTSTQPGSGAYSGPHGNARFKAFLAQQQLLAAEERNERVFYRLVEAKKQQAELAVQISRMDFTVVHYQEVIKVMTEGIRKLAEIKELWGKLVQFFANVKLVVKKGVEKRLNYFAKYVKKVQAKDQKGRQRMIKRQLLGQMKQIEAWTHGLQLVSGTYVSISKAHFMSQTAGLAKMTTASTKKERKTYMEELNEMVDKADKAVKGFVENKKDRNKKILEMDRKSRAELVRSLGGKMPSDDDAVAKGNEIAKLSNSGDL